jgi:hypothetical protein
MLPLLQDDSDADSVIEAPTSAANPTQPGDDHSGVDWDAELSKLLQEDDSSENASPQTNGGDSTHPGDTKHTGPNSEGNGTGEEQGPENQGNENNPDAGDEGGH